MRIYSVHIRRDGLDPAQDIVLVKEGFCWPAALFAPVWAVWHGLWRLVAVVIAVVAGVAAVTAGLALDALGASWMLAGGALLIGYVANDFWRDALDRRGFVLRDVVAATDREAAAFRFFDRNPWLAADVASAEGRS